MERASIRVGKRDVRYVGARYQVVALTCQNGAGQTHDWEAIERRDVGDVVVVFAVTPQRTVPLIEQFRPPVGTRMLELPAGLCDVAGETIDAVARRELEEETGWVADVLREAPPSAESSGTLQSTLHLFLATAVERRDTQYGPGEQFMEPRIIELPLDDLPAAVLRYHAEHPGHLIDTKILSGYAWWEYFEGGGR
ncbi:MAG: NUDIX hydrolase [bacterium]|nr:NUDIX hydrolase [bacterium]